MNKRERQEFARKFGSRVAKARRHKELTQAELGEAIGIGRVALANLEGGRNGTALYRIPALCRALGVSADELLRH